MIKVYVDTNLVGHNLRTLAVDHPEEHQALATLRLRETAGEISIVTSAVCTREVNATRDPAVRAELLRDADALQKIVPDEKVLGFQTFQDQYGGMSVCPLVSDVQDEEALARLERCTLSRRDAEHIAQAIASKCLFFLTHDVRTILSPERRARVQQTFLIKLVKPSELEAECRLRFLTLYNRAAG